MSRDCRRVLRSRPFGTGKPVPSSKALLLTGPVLHRSLDFRRRCLDIIVVLTLDNDAAVVDVLWSNLTSKAVILRQSSPALREVYC